jgi:hypothetical protein
MERRVIWLCVGMGSAAGGLAPEAWGGSALGLAAFALGVVGALAGLWVGLRLVS